MLERRNGAVDGPDLPNWVPEAAKNYLVHTEHGKSIRQVARGAGCHASTILRQIRKTESRRDDPLIDEALQVLGAMNSDLKPTPKTFEDCEHMNAHVCLPTQAPDEELIDREARRILRRLCEPQSCLAVAKDMEKAVVVREGADGHTHRTAVVDRPVAQAMALKDWITCAEPGRISRYRITTAGRAALKRLLAQDDATRRGIGDAQTPFADQHRDWDEKEFGQDGEKTSRRVRYNASESPIAGLARRRDKDGSPFLAAELVASAERLREDFELAHMGPRVTQNWDRFLTGGDRGETISVTGGDGPTNAKNRVCAALKDLGPGLGDVVLRVACFLEGLETAEKRMGWSARSGKVVLRIALQRLKRHYDETGNGAMIG